MLPGTMENLMQTKAIHQQTNAVEFLAAADKGSTSPKTRTAYRTILTAGALLLGISMCLGKVANAQQAATSSPAAKTSPQKVAQVVLPGSLETSLDSRKRKAGDQVVVKVGGTVTLKDGTSIPRGAKIVGHVTESKARSGGDPESSLAITFDTVNLPDGKTLAIQGAMQAVAPNPNEDDNSGGVDYGSSLNRTMEHAQSGTSVSSPVTILTEQSVGVYGIKSLQLGPDGVLKSNDKSVKLANRSQIVLRAQLTTN